MTKERLNGLMFTKTKCVKATLSSGARYGYDIGYRAAMTNGCLESLFDTDFIVRNVWN